MGPILRIALAFMVLIPVSGSMAQWQELGSGTNTTLRSVHFVNVDTGYVVGGSPVGVSIVLKTIDGGINWTPFLFPFGPQDPAVGLNAVHFINPDTGFVVGNFVYRTINGGQTWTNIYALNTSSNRRAASIYFCNDGNGHVVGALLESILETRDMGENWMWNGTTLGIMATYMNTINFPDNKTGYAGGTSPGFASDFGTIIKTSNGGETWGPSFGDPGLLSDSISKGTDIRSVHFTDSLNGWFAGGRVAGCIYLCHHNIFHTSDGGRTWDTTSFIFPSTLNDVFFVDRDKGFVADANGIIYATEDAGRTWRNENAPSAGREIHDIHCAGGACYAVGEGGMILKRALITSQGPPLDDGPAFSMFPNPANGTVTFVHDRGAPLRNARITVRDALGREVARLPLGGQDRTVWDTRGIPPGPYLVELLSDAGRIAVQRLVLSP